MRLISDSPKRAALLRSNRRDKTHSNLNTQATSSPVQRMLNIGCGRQFHTDWENIDLTGRFIHWNGLDPAQLPFGIEFPTSIQVAPALEYAPFPIDEFFIVWENKVGFDTSTIRAKRLYPDSGSEVGPSI